MTGIIRTIGSVLSVVAALTFSQAPEFAQQYEQRLGGALGELEPIIANFDADAARSDISREQALELYGRSHEQFLRDRGKSMTEVFDRYERLAAQRRALANSTELLRPVLIAYSVDGSLAADTVGDFRPGLPLTLAGAAYAALGFLLALLCVVGVRAIVRGAERMRWTTDL